MFIKEMKRTITLGGQTGLTSVLDPLRHLSLSEHRKAREKQRYKHWRQKGKKMVSQWKLGGSKINVYRERARERSMWLTFQRKEQYLSWPSEDSLPPHRQRTSSHNLEC